MQILFKVDQAEALRRGINAPGSTVKLDIDPAELTQTERDVLAAVLIDGHDATYRGIQSESDELIGQAYQRDSRGVVSMYSDGSPTGPLVLVRPDLEGVKEAISNLLALRVENRGKILAERAQKEAFARAELEKLMQVPPETRKIGLTKCGTVTSWESETVKIVTYESRKNYHSASYNLSPADRERYEAWHAEVDAANEAAKAAAIEAAKPELERIVAERQAAKEAAERAKTETEARRKAQLEAKVALVGGSLAERWAAGRASEEEVAKLIRDEERAARGVSYTGSAEEWNRDDVDVLEEDFALTDPQWEMLKAFRARVPANAKITLYDIHDHERDDDDGEKTDTKIDRLLVAETSWKVGEFRVKADCLIGNLLDESS